jgi:alcohol dehydrogenase
MGNGAVDNVGELVKQFKGKKILIVTDPGVLQAALADKVAKPLKDEGIEVGIFDGCKPDAHISVIKDSAGYAIQGKFDLIIGLGGGSVLDTAKVTRIAVMNSNL